MPAIDGTSALKPDILVEQDFFRFDEELTRQGIESFERNAAAFPVLLRTKREYIKSLKHLQPGKPLILAGLNETDAGVFLATEVAQLGSRGLHIYIQSLPGEPKQVKITLSRDVVQIPGYKPYQQLDPQQPIVEIADKDFAVELANVVEKNPPKKAKWGLARSIGKSAAQLGVGLIPVVGAPAAFIMSMRGKLEKYGHYEGRVQLRDEDFKWESYVQERNDPQTGELTLYSTDISDEVVQTNPRLYWLRQLALYKEGFSFDARILNSLDELIQGSVDKKYLMEQLMFILGDRDALAELHKTANQLNITQQLDIQFPTINDIITAPPFPAALKLQGLHLLVNALRELSIAEAVVIQHIGGVKLAQQLNLLTVTPGNFDEVLDINDRQGWVNKLMRGKRINILTSIEAAITGARGLTGFSGRADVLASDAAIGFTQTVINANRRIKNRVAEEEVRLARALSADERSAIFKSELVSSLTAIGLGAMAYSVASFVAGLSLGAAEAQGAVGLARTAAGSGVKALIRGITGVSYGLFMGMRGREEGESVNFEYGLKRMLDFFAGQSTAGAFDRLVAGMEGSTEVLMHQIAHHLQRQTVSAPTVDVEQVMQTVSNVTPATPTAPIPETLPVSSSVDLDNNLPVKVGDWEQAGDVFTVNISGQPAQVFDNLIEYAKAYGVQLTQDLTFFYRGAEYTIKANANLSEELIRLFPNTNSSELSETFSFACSQHDEVQIQINGEYGTIESAPFVSADRYVMAAQNEVENPEAAANVSTVADFERQQQQVAQISTVSQVETPPVPPADLPDKFTANVFGINRELIRIDGTGNYREAQLNEYPIVPGMPSGHTVYSSNLGQMTPVGVEVSGKVYLFNNYNQALDNPNSQADVVVEGQYVRIGFANGRVDTVGIVKTDGTVDLTWDNPTVKATTPIQDSAPIEQPLPADTTTPNQPSSPTISGDKINIEVLGANRTLEPITGGYFRDVNQSLREFNIGGETAHMIYLNDSALGYMPAGIQVGDGPVQLFNASETFADNEYGYRVTMPTSNGDQYLKIQLVNGRVNVVTQVDDRGFEIKQLWDNPEVHATHSAGERALLGNNRPVEYVGDGYFASANQKGRTLTLAGGMTGYILYDESGNAIGIRTDDGVDHIDNFTPNGNPDGTLILVINGQQHTVKFENGYVDYIEVPKAGSDPVVVYDNIEVGTAKPVVSVPASDVIEALPPASTLAPAQPQTPVTPQQVITQQDGFNVDQAQQVDVGNGREAVMVVNDGTVQNYPTNDAYIYIIPGDNGSTRLPSATGFERMEVAFSKPVGYNAEVYGVILTDANGNKVFMDLGAPIPSQNATFLEGLNKEVELNGQKYYLQFTDVDGVTRLAGITDGPINSATDLNSVNVILRVGKDGRNWYEFVQQAQSPEGGLASIPPALQIQPEEVVPGNPALTEVTAPVDQGQQAAIPQQEQEITETPEHGSLLPPPIPEDTSNIAPPISTPEVTTSVVDGIQVDTNMRNVIDGRGMGVKVMDEILISEAGQSIYIIPQIGDNNPGTFTINTVGSGELAFSEDGKTIVGMIVTDSSGQPHFVNTIDLATKGREDTVISGLAVIGEQERFYYFVNDGGGVTRLALISNKAVVSQSDLDNLKSEDILFQPDSTRSNTTSIFRNLLRPDVEPAPTESPTLAPTTAPVTSTPVPQVVNNVQVDMDTKIEVDGRGTAFRVTDPAVGGADVYIMGGAEGSATINNTSVELAFTQTTIEGLIVNVDGVNQYMPFNPIPSRGLVSLWEARAVSINGERLYFYFVNHGNATRLALVSDVLVDDQGDLETITTENTYVTFDAFTSFREVLSPAPTSTPIPTATNTLTPTPLPSTPTFTPEPTDIPTDTPAPTGTFTPVPTVTVEQAVEIIPTEPVVPTATSTPTQTPLPSTSTFTPEPTDIPTNTPLPTLTPTTEPSSTPSPVVLPTETPTSTSTPAERPTLEPPPFTSTPTEASIQNGNLTFLVENFKVAGFDPITEFTSRQTIINSAAQALVGLGYSQEEAITFANNMLNQTYTGPNAITVLDARANTGEVYTDVSNGTTPITFNTSTNEYEVGGLLFRSGTPGVGLVIEEIVQAGVYNKLLDSYQSNPQIFASLGLNSIEEVIESLNSGQLRAVGEAMQIALLVEKSGLGANQSNYEFTTFLGKTPTNANGFTDYSDVNSATQTWRMLIANILTEQQKQSLGWGENNTTFVNILLNPGKLTELNGYLAQLGDPNVLNAFGFIAMNRGNVGGPDDTQLLVTQQVYDQAVAKFTELNTPTDVLPSPTEPPTYTPTPSPTNTEVPATSTPTSTLTSTSSPTPSPTPTLTPTQTLTPTLEPTLAPTETATVASSPTPFPNPSVEPTSLPTEPSPVAENVAYRVDSTEELLGKLLIGIGGGGLVVGGGIYGGAKIVDKVQGMRAEKRYDLEKISEYTAAGLEAWVMPHLVLTKPDDTSVEDYLSEIQSRLINLPALGYNPIADMLKALIARNKLTIPLSEEKMTELRAIYLPLFEKIAYNSTDNEEAQELIQTYLKNTFGFSEEEIAEFTGKLGVVIETDLIKMTIDARVAELQSKLRQATDKLSISMTEITLLTDNRIDGLIIEAFNRGLGEIDVNDAGLSGLKLFSLGDAIGVDVPDYKTFVLLNRAINLKESASLNLILIIRFPGLDYFSCAKEFSKSVRFAAPYGGGHLVFEHTPGQILDQRFEVYLLKNPRVKLDILRSYSELKVDTRVSANLNQEYMSVLNALYDIAQPAYGRNVSKIEVQVFENNTLKSLEFARKGMKVHVFREKKPNEYYDEELYTLTPDYGMVRIHLYKDTYTNYMLPTELAAEDVYLDVTSGIATVIATSGITIPVNMKVSMIAVMDEFSKQAVDFLSKHPLVFDSMYVAMEALDSKYFLEVFANRIVGVREWAGGPNGKYEIHEYMMPYLLMLKLGLHSLVNKKKMKGKSAEQVLNRLFEDGILTDFFDKTQFDKEVKSYFEKVNRSGAGEIREYLLRLIQLAKKTDTTSGKIFNYGDYD